MMKADVVICGGAIIGSAIAWFLRDLGFDGSIVVVERDPTLARSSTALAASGIRQQFSDPLNVAISRFGVDFIRSAPDRWGIDLHFRENGYLYLADTPEGAETLRENHRVQRGAGADIVLLDAAELAERFPHLRTADITLASCGQSGEGWFDNMGLLQGFRRADVQRLTDGVCRLGMQNGRVESVGLTSGGEISCGVFVNAAGPAAGDVARMAGLHIPLERRKRTNFLFDCAVPPTGDLPLMIDPGGVWVRPEGQQFLTGCTPPEDPAVPETDFEPRYREFEDIIWPALAERSENFEAIKLQRFWAGQYAYNILDRNAVIGPHPEVANFLFANGFSGHGLQQAPAVGRGVAEWIVFGGYRSLDLAPLGYQRVVTNTPLQEKCVI